MVFSYNWLQSFFKKRLPNPQKLAELLTMHSFEVSEVKKIGKDWILDIDVLPNRASDCFSHLGIAREISAITGLSYQNPSLIIREDKELKTKDFVSVEVKSRQACPRYTARVITEVKVGFSPKWIRERLQICGLRPINNVVDIANYVMLETGQPLHAFDLEKLESTNPKSEIQNPKQISNPKPQIKKIIVRFAKEGEKIVTLDEEKYDLEKNILVIADTKKPIAIAGIKGGLSAKIDLKTKVVVLESANFNSRVIRRGSKSIDLKTDASWRFEHGLDPNLTELAINRAAYLIQEITGGRVALGLVDVYPQKVLPKQIKLDLNYAKSLLGIEIPKTEILKILKKLEFKIAGGRPLQSAGGDPLQIEVQVPTFRLDISLPEDLIEEIGRIYGYQKIPARFPLALLQPPKRNLDIFWEDRAKDILKEIGFSEVYNYSFISEKGREIFQYKNTELVEIVNPISSDFQYLRPSLIPNLLKNIEKNQRNFGEIKIFELGKIFKKDCKEKRALSGVITGEAFYELKGVVDLLLNKLGISNIWYDEYQPTPEESKFSLWHPKKCAEIKVNHEEIGFLGEISPRILDNLKIGTKVTVFDIDFEKLSKLASEEHEYQPISRFPSAIRDLAILVPWETRIEEVLNEIETAGGLLIRDIDLFDIYEGEELPAGKKSLAFHIIYQAQDRTLTSEEINLLQKKIISVLEKNSGWEVRK
ncbi:MAG: phenylalanine--tRNA ligase subunit beta [Patescibacteria group bacterium]|nr:phenylalanine--tRNA ligase subunit beta [Patescibacteria group bacterium]